MDVIVTVSRGKERIEMKTFTIDDLNNITAFASPEEAAATDTTPFDSFATEAELAELAANWPAERLVSVWNSLPGVKPAKVFKNSTAGLSRIWGRVQHPGQSGKPVPERAAKGGAQVAKGASAKAKSTGKRASGKNAPKAARNAKKAKAPSRAARDGSKTAQVIGLLARKGGATLAEIIKATGWQPHSVRGFIAGAMKKAGYSVESFKSEKGERSYKINA